MQSIQKMFAPRDLTQGKPMTGIVQFAIPLLLGNLAQVLYNTVDAIVVGKYVGDNALGAVGLAGPVINLMIVLFMGISTGASIVVSQYFGAKDRDSLSKSVGTIMMLTLISSVIMSIVGTLCANPLLVLLGTPAEMLEMASAYLSIVMMWMVSSAFYNILGGVLRGMGDSVGPLLYLLVASILNIILDILFVTQFGMTTDGVALATGISQFVSAILCVRRLYKMKNVIDFNRSIFKIDKPIMMRIVRLGLPSGLTQMIFSLSSILVQSLTNSLGPLVVTASTAIMRVDGFAMMPNFTFGVAATTFTGQNIGARRLDRVREGAKVTMKLAVAVSTVMTLGILLFGENLMRVFTQTDEIVNLGVTMFRTLAVGYIVFGITQTLQGVMRGAGETMIPMYISVITTVVLRMPIAYLWAHLSTTPELPNGDPMCLYGSLLIAWITGCVLTSIAYRQGNWKKKSGIVENETIQPEGSN